MANLEYATELEKVRNENDRLRGHIYASNRPQPEDFEKLNKQVKMWRLIAIVLFIVGTIQWLAYII